MAEETSLSLSSLIYSTKEFIEISVPKIVFVSTLMCHETAVL